MVKCMYIKAPKLPCHTILTAVLPYFPLVNLK